MPATNWATTDLAAQGAIVASAHDEARFLVALVQGRILSRPLLKELETPSAASGSYALGTLVERTCAGTTFSHNGGGASWSSSVAVTGDGKRVAVLLLNGHSVQDPTSTRYRTALLKLFCAA